MLVDDHEVVRLGLKTLFSQSDSISVIGEAATVTQAISVAGKLNPDVILMDLRLPDGTGIEACREILSANHARRDARVFRNLQPTRLCRARNHEPNIDRQLVFRR